MAVSERDRRDAYTALEQAHGEKAANTIMQLLPNQPADQLVTRTDMHAFGSELRGEMAELRGEVRGDIARLDAKIVALGGDLRTEMANLRVDTQRLMIGAIAANAVALIGVIVA